MHNRSYIIHFRLSSGTHTHTHTHTQITHSLPLVRTMDDVMQTSLPNCKHFQVSMTMCLLVTRDALRNSAQIISCPRPLVNFRCHPPFTPTIFSPYEVQPCRWRQNIPQKHWSTLTILKDATTKKASQTEAREDDNLLCLNGDSWSWNIYLACDIEKESDQKRPNGIYFRIFRLCAIDTVKQEQGEIQSHNTSS
jgi:hypothetical protein